MLLAREASKAILVQLLGLFRTDDADLVVLATKPTTGVADRMYVQLGRLGFARLLTKALSELLLKIVVKVILLAEKYNATLGDYLIL